MKVRKKDWLLGVLAAMPGKDKKVAIKCLKARLVGLKAQ